MIYLYNTASKKKEQFVPIKANKATVYSCGPTVYDYPHIGNWYSFIRWDVLVSNLRYNAYDVDWVMNITDVGHLVSDADEGEDKLEKGARREGKTARQIADYYTRYYQSALERLQFGVLTHRPQATHYIDEQIALIKTLEDKGFTYKIDDGIYFNTQLFPNYGAIANIKNNKLKAGARVEYNPQKKNPTDFALWKFSPLKQTRDMEWDSPWGVGFPGWHIECSAMSMSLLGPTLDIHTGGIDHITVHHPNEIAQSEAATNQPFAHYWLHSNFTKVNGKKMSKSLGNLITLEDIEAKGYDLQSFRLLIQESHYRKEAQFSWDVLEAAHNRLKRWSQLSTLIWQQQSAVRVDDSRIATVAKQIEHAFESMKSAMNDDMNTPQVLTHIEDVMHAIEKYGMHVAYANVFNEILQYIASVMHIQLVQADISLEQKEMMQQRAQARLDKDWQQSDAVRQELLEQGIAIDDTSYGQRWYRI